MKTSLPPFLLRLLLAAGLSALAQAPLHADEDGTTVTVKLSAPAKPATLRIDMPWADIHIVGVDGDTVTVESTLNQKGAKDPRNGGLRRLDDEVSFELTEHENVVSLTLAGGNPWSGNDAEFKISVPRNIALDVKTETGGDLDVKNVTGDIEINNMNGEVRLEGIAGSAVVSTMNGEVHAIYAKVPQKLVSITSMNGEIDLQIPSETKANVRLRTHNGSILTDFDDKVLKTKSEGKSYGSNEAARMGADAARVTAEAVRTAVQVANEFAREISREVERGAREGAHPDARPSDSGSQTPRPPRPPMPPITGGKLVSGTLNGGGIDIKISTMNGEITLRQTNSSDHANNNEDSSSTSEKVTVNFQDADRFTDVEDNHTNSTNTAALDELRDYVKETAAKLIPTGNKLTVTFLDLDLAGMVRPDKDNIRVMTSTTVPRAYLKFQLVDNSGKVVQEGERKLSDMNYQQTTSIIGRNESLFYDKQLLKDWLNKEFKA